MVKTKIGYYVKNNVNLCLKKTSSKYKIKIIVDAEYVQKRKIQVIYVMVCVSLAFLEISFKFEIFVGRSLENHESVMII